MRERNKMKYWTRLELYFMKIQNEKEKSRKRRMYNYLYYKIGG